MSGEKNNWQRRFSVTHFAILFVAASFFLLNACGGGSVQSGSASPQSPTFTLSLSPTTPAVAPGSSSTFQVSEIGQNGFNGTVSVTVFGLPSGLSVAPSSFTLQNNSQTVTLTAASSMAGGNYSFILSATSGSLGSSLAVNVGVGPLQAFAFIQPAVLEVVTRFGTSASVPLQTRVCCGAGPSDYSISLSVQGLPAGLTASFSSNPIPAGGSSMLTLTAAATGQWIQNKAIGVVGVATASVPTQTLGLDLVVAPAPGTIPNNRSDYLRTDDTPRAIAYDPVHQLVFSSDFLLDRVDIVSTSTRQIVRSVPVLSPQGLALTLDGSEVLVGSDAQQVTAISTTSLQIVHQWKLPRVSGVTQTYGPKYLYPLSNGNVMVRSIGLGGGSFQLALWNPGANTMSILGLPGNVAEACFGAGSADGTKLIVADCSSAGGAAVYDSATNTFGPTLSVGDFIEGLAASPDSSRFVIFGGLNGVVLYDNQLRRVSALIPPARITGSVFSRDGKRVYVVGNFGVPVIGTFDGATGAFINTAPGIGTNPANELIVPSPFVETPFAVDTTGIIFGSADHGIAFDDSTYSVNYILGFNATSPLQNLVSPDYGPVNSATRVNFPQGAGFSFLPDVWFGSSRGTDASLGQVGNLSVTAPPLSQPGPVNIKVIQPDGTPIFNPLAFSYGPFPMFVNGNTANPAGGTTSHILGVGLPADPTQIQVSVGNKSAVVLSATKANIQSLFLPMGYPYPLVDIQVALPSGSGDADIQVTTSAGSATLSKAIHYFQSITDYPSSDKFHAIVLDRTRNQLYLSAGDHIDIFSLTTKQFLSPLAPPAVNGQKAFHGLAMTPDGTKLIVTNFPDGSVALIDLNQPSSMKAVQIIPPGTFFNPGTENVVTTNTGKAFIEPRTLQSAGCGGNFYELDLTSLQVTTIGSIGAICIQPEGFPIAASTDGSKVLLTTSDISGPQQIAIYDVPTNGWAVNTAVASNFGAVAGVSANGSVFASGSAIVDANANLAGYLVFQEVIESGVGFAVPMEKVSDGGSLVYVAYPGFVDIFDVNHGALLRRIVLTEQIQQVTDAMAIDSNGENIYLITNAGVTVVYLGTAPLSIGSVTPAAGPAGTKVTIHGSGFLQGSTVSANGTLLTTTFVDRNTLQAVMQNTAAGAVQLTVADPAGHSYSLDNAFTSQ